MSGASAWRAACREAALLRRERSVWAWWLLVLCLSALAVAAGWHEVRTQRDSITRMAAADRADRAAAHRQHPDWGGAAYYGFHLTADPPSRFAFAALGRRDDLAWKHRIRLLALEGQIHERDAGHPVLAQVGRFDFAFLAAFVLPLVLIALLYDLRASERLAGRHDLLVATAGQGGAALWRWRVLLRSAGVWLAAALPLLLGGAMAGAPPGTLAAAVAALAAYLLFWALLCTWVGAWARPGELILAVLIGLWLLLAVLLPAAGRLAIDRAVPLPAGADIVLTQREAVNQAWDLPKAATMAAFVARHPQWAAHAEVARPFEWKWYYAFQQVGDQRAEALSRAHTAGRLARDRWAARLAWALPPVLMARSLQRLAGTDVQAALAYEARVRAFHAALRAFYYPRLFGNEAFDAAALAGLPVFAVDAPADAAP